MFREAPCARGQAAARREDEAESLFRKRLDTRGEFLLRVRWVGLTFGVCLWPSPGSYIVALGSRTRVWAGAGGKAEWGDHDAGMPVEQGSFWRGAPI